MTVVPSSLTLISLAQRHTQGYAAHVLPSRVVLIVSVSRHRDWPTRSRRACVSLGVVSFNSWNRRVLFSGVRGVTSSYAGYWQGVFLGVLPGALFPLLH